MVYFIDKTNRHHSRMRNREDDIKQLLHESKTNPDPVAREKARYMVSTLKNESKEVRDMRESLIKAHRQGNKEEVKDIHEIVKSKRKYQNE